MENIIQLLYQSKEKAEKGEVVNKDLIHFLGFCLAHFDKSKSQNFQDLWVMYETGQKYLSIDRRSFVEFGATNGIDGSNTYLLEREQYWTGVLAEPNPVYHDELRKNRIAPVDTRAIFNTTGEKLDFIQAPASDLSTLVGFENNDYNAERRVNGEVIQVETVTLFDFLEQHQMPDNIDYISVDTEGTELEILKKFFAQNNKYNVNCWTIEHNFEEHQRQAILELMMNNGYKRKFPGISRWDDYFIKVK